MNQKPYFTHRIANAAKLLILAALIFNLGTVQIDSRAAQTLLPPLEPILVTGGLTQPVHITHAGDGSGRLFIVEQRGAVRVFSGSLLTEPLLDIQDQVRSTGGEEGLLSVAFPPGYAQKGYFYVYYTNLDGDNQVSRFHLGNSINSADPASEEVILLLPHPTNSNHNGGQLAFGPDGYLYIGTGDGGGTGDPFDNAQNLDSLLGKILRIDVEPEPAMPPTGDFNAFMPALHRGLLAVSPPAYHIPADNPFVSLAGARAEIWAYGLRNPWRFSFDRLTGDLWIGDVGQAQWEEIDLQLQASKGGENYGWDVMEGTHCYGFTPCDPTGKILPIFEYDHSGQRCSVTGGFVYRGSAYPDYFGTYFLADYCSREVWGLTLSGDVLHREAFPAIDQQVTSFGEDENGEMYLTDYSAGAIYRLAPAQQQVSLFNAANPGMGESHTTTAPGR
ncbi:MAG TPA: PQQ-dependent sugar dehydrogenase [Anaerolineales bacterium]|nr:PQQ-dependent sugar dehydrogenase [Anaerolineales bacterium]